MMHFFGRGAGGAALQIGGLGCHPPYVQGPGRVSGPGGETSDGAATAEDTGREADIHLGGNGKLGVRVIDNGGIHHVVPGQGQTVHCYAITVIPVLGVGKGAWGASRDAVVGTGRN